MCLSLWFVIVGYLLDKQGLLSIVQGKMQYKIQHNCRTISFGGQSLRFLVFLLSAESDASRYDCHQVLDCGGQFLNFETEIFFIFRLDWKMCSRLICVFRKACWLLVCYDKYTSFASHKYKIPKTFEPHCVLWQSRSRVWVFSCWQHKYTSFPKKIW